MLIFACIIKNKKLEEKDISCIRVRFLFRFYLAVICETFHSFKSCLTVFSESRDFDLNEFVYADPKWRPP